MMKVVRRIRVKDGKKVRSLTVINTNQIESIIISDNDPLSLTVQFRSGAIILVSGDMSQFVELTPTAWQTLKADEPL